MNDELVQHCKLKVNEMKRKASHNKNETLWSFKLIMISTLAVPIFISFGDGDIYGKLIPSILAAISAFLTAWLQLRKPNQLWSLYRSAQRDLENELLLYKFGSEKYSDAATKEKILIEDFSKIYMKVNENWTSLVPTKDDVVSASKVSVKNESKKAA